MTMYYKNTTHTSCVYDALKQAGIPADNSMLNGLKLEEVEKILKKHGYKCFRNTTVNLPDNDGFFVVIAPNEIYDFAHIEYHLPPIDDVLKYPSDRIGAVFLHKRSLI